MGCWHQVPGWWDPPPCSVSAWALVQWPAFLGLFLTQYRVRMELDSTQCRGPDVSPSGMDLLWMSDGFLLSQWQPQSGTYCWPWGLGCVCVMQQLKQLPWSISQAGEVGGAGRKEGQRSPKCRSQLQYFRVGTRPVNREVSCEHPQLNGSFTIYTPCLISKLKAITLTINIKCLHYGYMLKNSETCWRNELLETFNGCFHHYSFGILHIWFM